MNYKGITVTPKAILKIKKLIENDKKYLGIRISIKKSGCAGFSYFLQKENKYLDNDLVYEYEKIKVFISVEAISFLDGTVLDYVKEGLNYEFKFYNPKAQYVCGCGSSFGI